VASPASDLRVVHVLEAVGGGTLRHLLDLLRSVPGVDHHVVLPLEDSVIKHNDASARDAPVRAVEATGATVHRLRMVRFPLAPANYGSLWQLRTLLGRVRPTVLHGHSSMGGAFVRMVGLGHPVPVAYTPNGLATKRSILLVERALAPLTDRLIAVSESEGELALSLRLIAERRLVVINNGIDVAVPAGDGDGDGYDLRSALDLPADAVVVGTVARLVAQKAPVDFVRMSAALRGARPDVHFVLIGSGELQADVDAAVRAAGVGDRFHQIRFLPNASAAIGQLNVFALNSRFEGGPYTPLEAMRAGVPVVLTDVVGSRDCVVDGVSGLVFPFGDTAGMAGGVGRILSDGRLRDSLVAAADQRFREKFDVARMGALHQQLYEELAVDRSRRVGRVGRRGRW
jgi:glycosyltransferase involved in cell wall biosynthesis